MIFISGGASSGKSQFAVDVAEKIGKNTVFVATCAPHDREMKKKVLAHRSARPFHWKTVEAGKHPFVMNGIPDDTDCLLLDSLSLWVSSLVIKGFKKETIVKDCLSFLTKAQAKFPSVIVVSDEVGCGIVPESRVARKFREALGVVNQEVAKQARDVFFVLGGGIIPLKKQRKSARLAL